MPDIRIASATLADAANLKALLEAAYRGDSARAGWNHEADLLDDERIGADELAALLIDPAVTILTARAQEGEEEREEAALVGCVALTQTGAGKAYLGMLCVAPLQQSGGLGGRLLDAAEALARARGVAVIEMTVIDSRASLIAWYERRGYAFSGETRPYHALRPVAGEAGPDITFVVLAKRLGAA